MTTQPWGPWTRDVQPVEPEPVLVTGPRDDEDEWLRREAGSE